MRLFDLHADTLTACFETSEGLGDNNRQISLRKTGQFDSYAQVFAIFTPDGMEKPFDYFRRAAQYAIVQFYENRGSLRFCKTAEELRSASEQGKTAALLAAENGNILGGSAENLLILHALGVRLLTLCWNGENELGCGAVTANRGLTPFGKRAVRACEKLGILVDVSHLSEKGFYDVAETASRPFLASHSNAFEICPHPRNLTAEQIRILRMRGGLIGINLHRPFLSEKNAGLDDVYRMTAYFLEQGCESVLAMGADYDGGDMAPEWGSIDKMELVCEYLYQRGLDETLLDKLMYGNAYEFFMRNLKRGTT
ncbi:MAG TPA: hypothetical protein DEQ02_09855 [Ruminococcaceae bacterium]|nr:hypothetical protein [Oscillospiraceae bacterium]